MTNEEKQPLLKGICVGLPYGEWGYLVACQKEFRQLELQILNNASVPLDWLNAGQFGCRGSIPIGLT